MNYSEKLTQTQEGWWVIRDDVHFADWVAQAHRLDHDQPVLQILAPYIRSGTTVLDCGANIGTHTIFYLDKVGLAGTVYAFEPHPLAYECLTRNCPKACCYNCALGSRIDDAYLVMDDHMPGSSWLVDPKIWPLARKVTVFPLDHLVPPRDIGLIKLDVEGCEPDVIRGASKIIFDCRPVLWLEVNPEALEKQGHTPEELRHLLIDELQYKVEFWHPGGAGWNGYGSGQSDVLCVPISY